MKTERGLHAAYVHEDAAADMTSCGLKDTLIFLLESTLQENPSILCPKQCARVCDADCLVPGCQSGFEMPTYYVDYILFSFTRSFHSYF